MFEKQKNKKPKDLIELAVRMEHESKYWTGYDPSLIDETVALVRTTVEDVEYVTKQRDDLLENRYKDRLKVAFHWIGAIVLSISLILSFNFAFGSFENVKNNVYKEILEGNSKISIDDALIDNNFSKMSNSDFIIYIKRVGR